MKVAVVHDWLDSFGGAEKVLEQILALHPGADLYLVADVMAGAARAPFDRHRIVTSFIQRLPFAGRHFRRYLPLMPCAVARFDLSAYDLILSSSHCVAKGVTTRPGQVHICYCHTPMRYIWDLESDYLQEHRITGARALLARALFRRLRKWDRQNSGVDVLVANSHFIAERISRCYQRQARVIYPPVDVDRFPCCGTKEDYYVTASRLVSQKKVGLIVEAFARMPEKRLVVVGDGPCLDALRRTAGDQVTFTGHLPAERLRACLAKARAFVYASLEDFGIVMVEAQACGTPVIAFGRGGALEIVREGETGLFYSEQSAPAIIDAVRRFEATSRPWSPAACHANAARFSRDVFLDAFADLVRRSTLPAALRNQTEIDSAGQTRV
jgi:glycosyltransferase involved in cell wall biosynthesis